MITMPAKEHYGKIWKPIYSHGKEALENMKTNEIKFPSKQYITRHHPQGPWDS